MSDDAVVLVFRTFRRSSIEWDPEPLMALHVSCGPDAAPEQLSWIASDGRERSIAFAPDLSSWYGERREPDARTVDIRGELARRDPVPAEEPFPGYEFATDAADPVWRRADRLRVLLDDGTDGPPRWVAWRDQRGSAYALSLWGPSWSGEEDFIVSGGLRIQMAALGFSGYHRPAGEAPVPFRGVHSNGPPSTTPAVTAVEHEQVPLEDPPTGTPPLPVASTPLVRTDFTDDAAWAAAAAEVTADRFVDGDGDGYAADVEPVDDARYDGLTAGQLCRLVPPDAEWALLLVADRTTMTSPERTVLVVDLDEDTVGRTFRATPDAVLEIESNLGLSNMDWEDFANDTDADGVFRSGFA